MRCREAAEFLLEAEPAELAGVGDSALAAHLRGCARCAAVGARLLEGERVLGEVLRVGVAGGERRAMRGVEEALAEFEARVAVVEEGMAGDGGGRRPPLHQPHSRWRRAAMVAVPLAVAASLALMLAPWWGSVSQWRRDATVPLPVSALRLAEGASLTEVVVPAGHDAVLFRTSNPKITIVWIY